MSTQEKAPISMRIRLKYPDVDTFLKKYSAHISEKDMFVQSRTPSPVGTAVKFELCLVDDTRLIAGEGQVAWVQAYDASNPSQPHGMGIVFSLLDDASRTMIQRAVAAKAMGARTENGKAHLQVSAAERELMALLQDSGVSEARVNQSLRRPGQVADESRPREQPLTHQSEPRVDELVVEEPLEYSSTKQPLEYSSLQLGKEASIADSQELQEDSLGGGSEDTRVNLGASLIDDSLAEDSNGMGLPNTDLGLGPNPFLPADEAVSSWSSFRGGRADDDDENATFDEPTVGGYFDPSMVGQLSGGPLGTEALAKPAERAAAPRSEVLSGEIPSLESLAETTKAASSPQVEDTEDLPPTAAAPQSSGGLHSKKSGLFGRIFGKKE